MVPSAPTIRLDARSERCGGSGDAVRRSWLSGTSTTPPRPRSQARSPPSSGRPYGGPSSRWRLRSLSWTAHTHPRLQAWGQEAAARDRPRSPSPTSRPIPASSTPTPTSPPAWLCSSSSSPSSSVWSASSRRSREGTLARLMAAPIGRSSVVAGKAILSFCSGCHLDDASSSSLPPFLMGAEWGPTLGCGHPRRQWCPRRHRDHGAMPPPPPRPEGAGNLGAIVAVILGMLGGHLLPDRAG